MLSYKDQIAIYAKKEEEYRNMGGNFTDFPPMLPRNSSWQNRVQMCKCQAEKYCELAIYELLY